MAVEFVFGDLVVFCLCNGLAPYADMEEVDTLSVRASGRGDFSSFDALFLANFFVSLLPFLPTLLKVHFEAILEPEASLPTVLDNSAEPEISSCFSFWCFFFWPLCLIFLVDIKSVFEDFASSAFSKFTSLQESCEVTVE